MNPNDTAILQQQLGVKPDGIYGEKTAAAKVREQLALGLQSDNVWVP